MALSAALVPLAKRLIEQFGTRVVLRQYMPGEYDAATRSSTSSERDRMVKVIPRDFKARWQKGQQGGRETGDLSLLLAADGLVDEPVFRAPGTVNSAVIMGATIIEEDPVLFEGGQEHRILDIKPTYADDQVVLYELHARR